MSNLSCILKVLNQCNLPAGLIRYLRDNYKVRFCHADEVIFHQKEYWNSVFIVKKGLLRFYYEQENGGEVNKCFLGEGEYMAPVWDENTRFNFSLASMEESVILIIGLDVLKDLLVRNQSNSAEYYQRFENKVLKNIVLKKIDREMSQITMNATERYAYALKTMPEIVERIPQYHLASYLGITPVTLSRIKSSYVKMKKV